MLDSLCLRQAPCLPNSGIKIQVQRIYERGNMDIRIDEKKNIVYITLEGESSGKEIVDLFQRVLSMSGYKKGMARIWDLRNGDFTKSSLDDIFYVCDHTSLPDDDINDVRVALVAGRDMSYAASSAFTAISQGSDRRSINVVSSMEEAEEWVREG